MTRLLLIVALIVSVAGLGVGLWRVIDLEAHELDHRSPWRRLEPTLNAEGEPEPHRELGRVELQRGETVTFELCARGGLDPERWVGQIDLAIWLPEARQVAIQQPLDAEVLGTAAPSPEGTCVTIAEGGELRQGGTYAVEAIWSGRELSRELRRVPLQVRITAFEPLSPLDRLPSIVLLAGSILLVVLLARKRPSRSGTEPPGTAPPEVAAPTSALRVGLGVICVIAAVLGVAYLPIGGALGGVARAAVIAAVQLLAAILLISADHGRRGALGLSLPRQGAWVLWLAPVVGVGLWMLGQIALGVVPSTGESAMGRLVAWPSGAVAVALAAVITPIIEEIFFRGFLYGAIERRWGAVAAFSVTVVVFTLVHLPQTWGVWGGVVAILVTSIGLTALRWWTGSVIVPALAHLLHNGAIVLIAVAALIW